MSRGRCSRTVRIMRIRQSLCCQFRLYNIIIVSNLTSGLFPVMVSIGAGGEIG